MALMAFKGRKSGANGIYQEKYWSWQRWNGKMAALTALNRKNSGVNDGEPKKAQLTALNWRNSGSNVVESEK